MTEGGQHHLQTAGVVTLSVPVSNIVGDSLNHFGDGVGEGLFGAGMYETTKTRVLEQLGKAGKLLQLTVSYVL